MKELLMFFYFLSSIIILINEINWLINFDEQLCISEKIIHLLKNDEPIPKEYKYTQFESLFKIIWVLIGLITYQGKLFLVLIICVYSINILKKYVNDKFTVRITHFLFLFSSLFYSLYYYQLHLHIDLVKFF